MATKKKTDSGRSAATRKAAARKAAAKKTGTTKTAAAVAIPVRKLSAAKARAKEAHAAPAKVPGRKERRGVVVSDAMDKTIVVRIDVAQKHERYSKIVRRSSKLHAHDEHNTAGVGDFVRIVETRPLSATKRWRLLEVLEKAK